jgi:hypothetical protein
MIKLVPGPFTHLSGSVYALVVFARPATSRAIAVAETRVMGPRCGRRSLLAVNN